MSDPTTPHLPGGPLATIGEAVSSRWGGDYRFPGMPEQLWKDAKAALDLLSELVRAAQEIIVADGFAESSAPGEGGDVGWDAALGALQVALLPFETSTEEGK